MSRGATTRFTERVADYVRARPSYPPALLDTLAARHGLERSHVVADVGAGTGKLTELFLQRGHRVLAVEPNDAMRAAAESVLGGHDGFVSVNGTAEATGLENSSVDWVVAGQAFHWFYAAAAREEFQRILRPPARVVLIWHDRDNGASPLMAEYEAMLREHGTDYMTVNHLKRGEEPVAEFYGAGRFTRHDFTYEQVLDRDDFRRRVTSTSYTPGIDEPGHDALLRAIDRLFDTRQADGAVRLVYRTRLYVGKLAAGSGC